MGGCMKNRRKVLGVFIVIILLIFSYGMIYGYLYAHRVNISDGINLPKEAFVDMAFPQYDINNRALKSLEEKNRYYDIEFTRDKFEGQLSSHVNDKPDWYLMIEKPDAQFMEVKLNGQLLATYGEETGRANLWNGTFFIRFNEEMIQENNQLILTLKSDYMAGVAGQIMVLPYKDYRILEMINEFTQSLIGSSIVIAIFAGVILLMMIIAWKDQLYYIQAYVFFLVSILALSISLLDFLEISYLPIPYLHFKKLIITSYHVAISFAGLGIAYLLNAKYKWNIGIVGLVIILSQVLFTNDMITFRESYSKINLLLIVATVQLIIMLFYYRKRASIGASVLLIGFTLTGVTVAKLVLITSAIIESSMLVDLPILIIIYVTIVLFLFYLEMIQIVADYDVAVVDDRYDMGITNHMQGSFSIDKNLYVVGAYATACDHIFNRHIVGASVLDLFVEDNTERAFIKETLEMFFDPTYSFKEGFIALLPETLNRDERVYQINYSVVERAETLMRITLSDVTRSVELEKNLNDERKVFEFIINALKSRNEVGYFIERTRIFLKRLEAYGFTPYHQSELHTLKGTLGQFGFFDFEQAVHQVEVSLIDESSTPSRLVQELNDGFEASLNQLTAYVGLDFFDEGYGQLNVSKEEINKLEVAYQRLFTHPEERNAFKQQLRELKYVDFKEMFKRYHDYIIRMGHDTEKNILPFETTGEDIKVNPEKAENLLRVLVAIFRNAVVHGIEIPEERMDAGKDSFGTISCHIEKLGEAVIIEITDDGCGVDIDFVTGKAVQYGIISTETLKEMSPVEQLNLIFESGMSQLEDIDILAGRGIGLYSVKELAESLGGSIAVKTEIGMGTTFELNIPLISLRDL